MQECKRNGMTVRTVFYGGKRWEVAWATPFEGRPAGRPLTAVYATSTARHPRVFGTRLAALLSGTAR